MTLFDFAEPTLYLAQAATPAVDADKPETPFLLTLLPWLFIFGMIYFLFFRPISKARKEQEALVSTLKTGARVVTVGGIVGMVTNVKEKTAMIRTGDGTKIEVLKEKISNVEASGKDGKNAKDAKDEKAKDGAAADESDEATEVDVEVTEDDAPSDDSGNRPYNRSRRKRGSRR